MRDFILTVEHTLFITIVICFSIRPCSIGVALRIAALCAYVRLSDRYFEISIVIRFCIEIEWFVAGGASHPSEKKQEFVDKFFNHQQN